MALKPHLLRWLERALCRLHRSIRRMKRFVTRGKGLIGRGEARKDAIRDLQASSLQDFRMSESSLAQVTQNPMARAVTGACSCLTYV